MRTSDLARKLHEWSDAHGGARSAAREVGFPERTFSGWVSGDRRPSMAYAARIAEVTGIPLAEVRAGCTSLGTKPASPPPKPETPTSPKPEPTLSFHDAFVKWFETCGRSQQDVADAVGVSLNSVKNWLRTGRPSTALIDDIVRVTGIPKNVVRASAAAPGRPRKNR